MHIFGSYVSWQMRIQTCFYITIFIHICTYKIGLPIIPTSCLQLSIIYSAHNTYPNKHNNLNKVEKWSWEKSHNICLLNCEALHQFILWVYKDVYNICWPAEIALRRTTQTSSLQTSMFEKVSLSSIVQTSIPPIPDN